MTPARFRKLVLALEGVTEVPHMNRTAYRTKRKIFATIGDNRRVHLIVEPEDRREALIESFPKVFFSLGGWSKLGYVAVEISKVDEALFTELVTEAYEGALPKKSARRAKR